MKKLLICIVIFLGCHAGFAQNEFETVYYRVGGGLALGGMQSQSNDDDAISSEGSDKGFTVFAERGVKFVEHRPCYLLVGLKYTQVKASYYVPYAWWSENCTEKLGCLSVPVAVTYKIGKSRINVEPYAGLNFSYYTLGEVKSSSSRIQINIFETDDVHGKRFQIGGILGAYFNFNPVFIGFRYSPYFTNFYNKSHTHTSFIDISAGFNLK